MARILSQTLIRTSSASSSSSASFIYGNSTPLGLSTRILTQRHRSDQSGKAQLIEVDLESDGDVEVLGIRRLEDVIHSIIVKRSAPDWLPFIPGSSYWVPPRRRPHGVIDVLGKLSNPLSEEETLSLTTVRGWPSSSYLIEGGSPTRPVPADVEVKVKVYNDAEFASRSEDEEG